MPFSFLSARNKEPTLFTTTDIHSHLLPGIDDGVQTMAESLEVIQGFYNLGYRKLITTPHIMGDFFKNTPAIINDKLAEVRQALQENDIDIDIHAAAEYYLDEQFLKLIEEDTPLLTFGENYVLFETSFISKPLYLKEAIFRLQTQGYRPVLAHPERYFYLQDDETLMQELLDSGVLFQLNLNSLDGYYSQSVQKMARTLIKNDKIALVGSDCHNAKQLTSFQSALRNKMLKYLNSNLLLNNFL